MANRMPDHLINKSWREEYFLKKNCQAYFANIQKKRILHPPLKLRQQQIKQKSLSAAPFSPILGLDSLKVTLGHNLGPFKCIRCERP